jgi:hypothetical protein
LDAENLLYIVCSSVTIFILPFCAGIFLSGDLLFGFAWPYESKGGLKPVSKVLDAKKYFCHLGGNAKQKFL